MNKKYKVSLAALKPVNFEIEVEAESELEAAQLAEQAFYDDFESGEIVGLNGDIECDFSIDESDFEAGSLGVNVQEIEDEDDAASGEQHYQD